MRGVRLLVVLAFVATASRVAAQEAPPPAAKATPPDAKRIKLTLSGGGELNVSGEVGVVAVGRDDLFGGEPGETGDEGDVRVEPRLRLDLELKGIADRPLDFALRVVNRRRRELATADDKDAGRRVASPNALEPRAERAYFELGKLIGPEWSLRAGLQNLRYELRTHGEALFMNLARAESPIDGAPISTGAGGRGTRRWFVLDQPLDVDVFALETLESEALHGGELVWGVNADLLIRGPADGVDNLANAIACVMSRGDDQVGTLGGGVDWHLSRYWELFGELYGQIGERVIARRTRDHRAWSGAVGARRTWWNLRSEPYLEAGAVYVSGGDPDGSHSRDFASYENVETFKILEDDDFGTDVDRNYWSLRLRAGLDLSPAIGEKVLFEVLYGYFRRATHERGRDDALGHEVDLRLTWKATDALDLTLGGAALFDARHFADRPPGRGGSGSDRALLLYLEAVLRF